MKTIYILLTRSGTLLSKLVYAATGASYTHASMAFDAELNCLCTAPLVKTATPCSRRAPAKNT